jgi:hypothetical protein
VADPDLRLCVTFDGPAGAQDLSPQPHVITDSLNISIIARDADHAAMFTDSSRLHFADAADLDVGELTVGLWALPDVAVQSRSAWLLDVNTQYALTREPSGRYRCSLGARSVDSVVVTGGAASWHHVACTYGADSILRVYVDGDVAGCLDVSVPIPTTGNEGLALGANYSTNGAFQERYVGGLDDVLVYARALTAAELCAAAHRTGCSDSCSSD